MENLSSEDFSSALELLYFMLQIVKCAMIRCIHSFYLIANNFSKYIIDKMLICE